jgi:hypothetical protein
VFKSPLDRDLSNGLLSVRIDAFILLYSSLFCSSDEEKGCGLRRYLSPGSAFYERENRNPSLSMKKKRSGNTPVEEGDWKILQSAAHPESSSTTELKRSFLHISTTDLTLTHFWGKQTISDKKANLTLKTSFV